RYYFKNENRLVIFPYRSGKLIDEKEMKKSFPLTFRYFQENRTYLEMREGGIHKSRNWYGFTRSQAIEIIQHPKIMTPDLSRSVAFAFDEIGDKFFPGGAAGGYGI